MSAGLPGSPSCASILIECQRRSSLLSECIMRTIFQVVVMAACTVVLPKVNNTINAYVPDAADLLSKASKAYRYRDYHKDTVPSPPSLSPWGITISPIVALLPSPPTERTG
ncbi:expressed unknown protein [Seminavis robusta]|uniref:Uncharacterized protein n=1 Tax=Seminavis robusta TaxID=568900 RepID=A0A9N8HAB2_9STRA|nr:expressed unknown protein [Seminavis robusta]|eukprot:Sro236_g094901.1  (111) ;mRNA; f:12493-12825